MSNKAGKRDETGDGPLILTVQPFAAPFTGVDLGFDEPPSLSIFWVQTEC
jgi:hypothetical protein